MKRTVCYMIIMLGMCMNYASGQKKVLDPETPKIVINIPGEHGGYPCGAYYSEKSDTTHYYLIFECCFNDDSLQVFCNDNIIYNDIIKTDYSVDVARYVCVGHVDSVKSLSFRINQDPVIEIHPIKGKYYMRVRRFSATAYICFSKYSPYYE